MMIYKKKKKRLFILIFFIIRIFVFSGDSVVSDLPLIELTSFQDNEYFSILISGDGGWKTLDQEVSKYLNNAGISVIGFDCFSYFNNKERTQKETSDAISRIINYYEKKFAGKKIVLIGYSFGADIIPFIFNTFEESTVKKIKAIVLLGLTETAQFKIDMREFVGIKTNIKRYPTIPELKKIDDQRILCICGNSDNEAACSFIDQQNVEIKIVPGSHHFNNAYKYLSGIIIEWLK